MCLAVDVQLPAEAVRGLELEDLGLAAGRVDLAAVRERDRVGGCRVANHAEHDPREFALAARHHFVFLFGRGLSRHHRAARSHADDAGLTAAGHAGRHLGLVNQFVAVESGAAADRHAIHRCDHVLLHELDRAIRQLERHLEVLIDR
jgi:hypothetical protein